MTARRYAGANASRADLNRDNLFALLLGATVLLTIAIMLGGCGRNGAQPKTGGYTAGDAGEALGQVGFAVRQRAGTVVRPSQTMPAPEPLRTRAKEKERVLTMELPVTPEAAKKKALKTVDYKDPAVSGFERGIWKDRPVYMVSVIPRPCLENPCVPRVDRIVIDGETGKVLDHETAW